MSKRSNVKSLVGPTPVIPSSGGSGTFAALTDITDSFPPSTVKITSTQFEFESISGADDTLCTITPTVLNWYTENTGTGAFSELSITSLNSSLAAGLGAANATMSSLIDGNGIAFNQFNGGLRYQDIVYSSSITELEYGHTSHVFNFAPVGNVIVNKTNAGSLFYVSNNCGSSITLIQDTSETFNGSTTYVIADGESAVFYQADLSGIFGVQTLGVTGGGGGVTSVSGTAPVVSSGGATPAISMAASTNSVDGYLTAADHTTYSASAVLTAAATSANTASAIVKRDADSRAILNQSIEAISTVAAAAGTTTLTKSSSHTLVITGSTTQTVVLPNATTLTAGETFTVINQSSGVVTVQDAGSNILILMVGLSTASFKATSIASSNGVWDINKASTNYGSIAGFNGTTTLTTASPRNINISGSSVGSFVLRLAAGNTLARGDTFTITNYYSDANSITIADNAGTTLCFLGPRNTMQFKSLDNTSAGGTWLKTNLNSGSATYQTGLMPRINSFGVSEFMTFGQPLGLANSTATYTMATADNYADFIYSTNTSATGAKQLTLLANNNRLLWVYCGSTGRLNIAVTGGGTINGSTTWSLTQQGQAVLLQNDGANYKVIATQGTPIETITASTLAPAVYSADFLLNSVSNNITVTLPTAAEASFMKGKRYGFTKISANNTVTFNTTSSQTMSGFASGTVFLTKNYSYIEFESDGTNWIISSDGRHFENTHLIGYGTAPTIAGGVGAGTTPTLSLVGVDQAAEISVTAGTVPTAASDVVTVSFNKSFSVAPIITITPSNANAAAQIVFVTSTTSGYTLTLATGTLIAATQYKWMCHVMGY